MLLGPKGGLVVSYSVGSPALVVGRWKNGRVTDGGPEELPGRIRHACDGIPGRCSRGAHPQPEPAVPGQVFQFDRAHKDSGVKARVRVIGQVFNTGRVVGVDILLLHHISYYNPFTAVA